MNIDLKVTNRGNLYRVDISLDCCAVTHKLKTYEIMTPEELEDLAYKLSNLALKLCKYRNEREGL